MTKIRAAAEELVNQLVGALSPVNHKVFCQGCEEEEVEEEEEDRLDFVCIRCEIRIDSHKRRTALEEG